MAAPFWPWSGSIDSVTSQHIKPDQLGPPKPQIYKGVFHTKSELQRSSPRFPVWTCSKAADFALLSRGFWALAGPFCGERDFVLETPVWVSEIPILAKSANPDWGLQNEMSVFSRHFVIPRFGDSEILRILKSGNYKSRENTDISFWRPQSGLADFTKIMISPTQTGVSKPKSRSPQNGPASPEVPGLAGQNLGLPSTSTLGIWAGSGRSLKTQIYRGVFHTKSAACAGQNLLPSPAQTPKRPLCP